VRKKSNNFFKKIIKNRGENVLPGEKQKGEKKKKPLSGKPERDDDDDDDDVTVYSL